MLQKLILGKCKGSFLRFIAIYMPNVCGIVSTESILLHVYTLFMLVKCDVSSLYAVHEINYSTEFCKHQICSNKCNAILFVLVHQIQQCM